MPTDDSQPQDSDLTPTQRRLLHALQSEPGRVFTRAELAARVMPDSLVLERTIDVHVKALRQKFGAARIETVRGVGYCYAVETPPTTREGE